mmetsp:Transcript_18083/g.54348  ORF Transcript_18083/g.54348 Transcript_18083/m.54348 type:complete len:294 (+) Transcript_18083:911-1792(+)
MSGPDRAQWKARRQTTLQEVMAQQPGSNVSNTQTLKTKLYEQLRTEMRTGDYLWQFVSMNPEHGEECVSLAATVPATTSPQDLPQETREHLNAQQRKREAKAQTAKCFLEALKCSTKVEYLEGLTRTIRRYYTQHHENESQYTSETTRKRHRTNPHCKLCGFAHDTGCSLLANGEYWSRDSFSRSFFQHPRTIGLDLSTLHELDLHSLDNVPLIYTHARASDSLLYCTVFHQSSETGCIVPENSIRCLLSASTLEEWLRTESQPLEHHLLFVRQVQLPPPPAAPLSSMSLQTS